MCNDVGETSRFCLAYSSLGFMFTLWVGILITYQEFYIYGLEDGAKESAFGAMGMFMVTFAASVVGIYWDENTREEESDIPEGIFETYELSPLVEGYDSYGIS
mmetsp:Transcript_20359/g.29441  ORF Transcript_20359/g.29441 Transcript_20359/m.29441 type:complete len:103 (+) Transcript_20359:92-400(+)|eukprot:CAMPEP_0202458440 /NCGR_PEP_ID=MMETSP1360-20130828/25279_1 /ASSEMBLY_ACC=CAM_ASM_000848 /TAXON_ID=515479 /ORGANISM="Licmophora paradoxa, Strain CCMP2313" /LENGTH=102 /DNA_ID=CAMNT_0049078979 /DNA_START=45 /DNA_END=353 /DNA_ORIENTATION=-